MGIEKDLGIMACTATAGGKPSSDGVALDCALSGVLATRALVPDSRFVQRVRRRYPLQMECVPANKVQSGEWEVCFQALCDQGLEPAAALRVLRQLVLMRLVELDCAGTIDLAVVCKAMSGLAAFALDVALVQAFAQVAAVHGMPKGPAGELAQMWVIGMGKLGARELNASSDIDLIYVYDHDGETAAAASDGGTAPTGQSVSNHEFFGKVAKGIQRWIADVTEHGQVFRIDLALRPNGNSGPVACSLAALEEYFMVQGREWERFAWLKSRVVAPIAAVANGSAQGLRPAVLSFVFRKYLDYNVFDSLRGLHQQIRDHAAKRAAGHPERANDVKLSRGGIREIEFTVQLLQVVRGGQFPELRTRATLDGLARIVRAGLMPADTAAQLRDAYVFLRNLEHRIQYLDDQQTHVLPTQDEDLAWIATSLGFESPGPLLCQFDAHREFVATEFNKLLGGAPAGPCKTGNCGKSSAHAPDNRQALQRLSPLLASRVQALEESPRVRALREASAQRLTGLVTRTAQWLAAGRVSEAGAVNSVDWIEPLLRRESYLALLWEQPQVHERLVKLLGTARWPARYLMQHPGVIDELASAHWLSERFEPAAFEEDLERRRHALFVTGEDNEEALMGLLRRAHHAEVFRTLARDVEGILGVEEVADDLSAMADSVLKVSLRWVWLRMKARHRDDAQCAVVAYGKLGGKELGYGSDLDIVFLYDDPHEKAGENYALLVRKLITWLTTKTAQGDLFEIDTALRPNGSAGLLVTSVAAFEAYQLGRGSNAAWTWEHQAITRARLVLGVPNVAKRFDAVRTTVLCAPRDPALLKREIADMRERVRSAHKVPSERFDVKHSAGGMVDVEFAVQYLVLAHAHAHPSLLGNLGNKALLSHAECLGLLPSGVGDAAGLAYRSLRRIQHQARLDEKPTQVPADQLATERQAVLALWAALGF